MIKHWKYQALNAQGQDVRGSLSATKQEIMAYIKVHQLELIDLQPDFVLFFEKFYQMKRLSVKTLTAFFEDLSNMQQTGLSLTQMLLSLRDSTQDVTLAHVIDVLRDKIEEGLSLADAFRKTNTFPWIVILTIKSGEQSGKLEASYQLLAQYFKRQAEIRHKLHEALTYPSIVFCLLISVMMYVGLNVIPKLKQLLPDTARLKGTASIVIAMSVCLQKHFILLLVIPVILLTVGIFVLRKNQRIYDMVIYRIPLMGRIKKETDLAFYFLNLSILLRNGVPLIKCINDLNALNVSIISRHVYQCRDYLFGGMPLWEALKTDPIFSSVVIFTIRRGEEMTRLPEYVSNLSGYFNKRVHDRVDQMVMLIQPALLLLGGVFLIIIAFAFLIPVYGSLTQIAGG